MSKKKRLIDTKVEELGQVVTAWICGLLFRRATDKSGQSSPQFSLYTSCVYSPSYRSDLYSESWLRRSNADGSETRPAGSSWTKSSPKTVPSPDRGFHALPHILDVHLLFWFHNKVAPRFTEVLYQIKTRFLSMYQIRFCFFKTPLGRLSKLKIAHGHRAAVLHHWWKHF